MNTRLPFLKWEPLVWIGILFVVMIASAVFAAIYYRTWEPIGVLAVVLFGMAMAAIVNRTNDMTEKAKNSRNPPGPDEILSFSLEHESKNKSR